MNKIPVFYHIHKSGGTYVITKCREILRYYNHGLGVLCIEDKHETLARIFLKNIQTKQTTEYKDIALSDILEEILFITIEPSGIRFKDHLLKNISSAHHFTILRHPFYRLQSLYNYIRSPESKHEPSHMSIKSESFENYILSNQFESNWVFKNFCDNNYDKAIKELQNINVYNMANIDIGISNCMFDCYNEVDVNKFDPKNVTVNACLKTKLRFTDLSYSTRKIFIKKTCWDLKLYRDLLC